VLAGTHLPNLLVGLDARDDATVYRLNDEQAAVLTVDFFAPLVDDPYSYGAIAAANAMSDVYAMGGEVLLALNVAAFPEDLSQDIIDDILRGGADKVFEAGGIIAGGHTMIDKEPKYGLCVLGLIHPERVFTKNSARPGDALYLSKKLGTGIITTAITFLGLAMVIRALRGRRLETRRLADLEELIQRRTLSRAELRQALRDWLADTGLSDDDLLYVE